VKVVSMAKKISAIDHIKRERAPKIVEMIPPGAPGYAEAKGGSMVVSTPAEVDQLIRQVNAGEVITLDDLRGVLAKRYETAVACPVSTAIFANMSARAAEEQRALGVDPKLLTPWWRVLKNGGFLNPKLPGGIERQRALLADEGVRSSPLRKHFAVYDYEARRPREFA
jgi:alkylated DNA nucleotide flippase Atl1